jgi:hypothetical protein
MAIVRALRPALAAGAEHDPYFDRLLPEIDGEFSPPETGSSNSDE